jgi:hypothetical protein
MRISVYEKNIPFSRIPPVNLYRQHDFPLIPAPKRAYFTGKYAICRAKWHGKALSHLPVFINPTGCTGSISKQRDLHGENGKISAMGKSRSAFP